MISDIQLKLCRFSEQEAAIRAVRTSVFIEEQGIDAALEFDEDDQTCLHAVAFVSGQATGTGRLIIEDHRVVIGRMAVLKDWRRHGVGALILNRLIEEAHKQKDIIELSGQLTVCGFYERFGFKAVGDVYDEVGIPHIKMIRVN